MTNHDRIFKLLKCDRDGAVDSEAIFRLLHHFTDNGKEPFSPEVIQEVCKRLHGSYACLAFTGNNPYQMVGFRDSRPMEALLIKPLKLLLLGSEKDFLKHVIFRYNKVANLYQIGTMKFPPLKKTDVELLTLPDDHLYIFDIRKEIEATSKIEDLFISEKVSRINKIWDNDFINRTAGFYGTKTNQTPNTNYLNKHTNDNYPNKHTNDKDKNRLGMAWNKETGFYQDINNLDVSEGYAGVEIDSKNGEVIEADTKKVLINSKKKVDENIVHTVAQKFNLKRTYTDVDSLEGPRAEIKELVAPVERLPVLAAKIPKTEIILETNPDALKKAETALQKEKPFKNNQEVQLTLEIDKAEHLNSLHPYSLANRVRRFFYKKGWYNGYIDCLHELEGDDGMLTSTNMLFRVNNKRKLAERNIKIIH